MAGVAARTQPLLIGVNRSKKERENVRTFGYRVGAGAGLGGGGALVAARRGPACSVPHPCHTLPPRAATRAPTPHPRRSRPYAVNHDSVRLMRLGRDQSGPYNVYKGMCYYLLLG